MSEIPTIKLRNQTSLMPSGQADISREAALDALRSRETQRSAEARRERPDSHCLVSWEIQGMEKRIG
jgi:hypothetical protein